MDNYSVTLNFDVTGEDIDTLIEMAGYGIGYWAQALDQDGENVHITIRADIEDTATLKTTTREALAKALAKVAREYKNYVGKYARDYFGEGDAGNIDADLADVVVQEAVFGKLIYG